MGEGWRALLPVKRGSDRKARIHMDTPDAAVELGAYIQGMAHSLRTSSAELVLMCIGTDRSIGDALGPLVGSMLEDMGPQPFHVVGTLDSPVHATNLDETLRWVHQAYGDPLILAVDACLGKTESVGFLTLSPGSLKPGAGVNKTLPAVGQFHLTGVVNVGGFMEYFVLQNTRLSLVMRMARIAAAGIAHGLGAAAVGTGSHQ